MSIPFRADIVGSFLRPEVLKKARVNFEDGKITKEQLAAVEDAEVKRLVNKEVELGLKAVTDGEFRQQTWYLDFLTSFKGVKWNKLRPEQYAPSLEGLSPYGEATFNLFEVVEKIEYNPDNEVFSRFLALKAITPPGIVAKVCVPSPSMYFQIGYSLVPKVYEGKKEEFHQDIADAYNKTIRKLYDLGLRYFEIDDCNFGLIACTYDKDTPEQRKITNQRLIDIPKVNNLALANLPQDLYLTMHICRGNFRSTAFGGGSYAPVAEAVAKG
jgi:methionine synthase II (cobalamin-independent)